MDHDEDAIIGSRALDREAADVDGISGAPLGSSSSGRRAGTRVRVPRAPPREGTFHAWLIKVDCEGEPHVGVLADASQGAQPSTHSIAGVCHCKWELAEPTEDNFIDHTPLNHHLPPETAHPQMGLPPVPHDGHRFLGRELPCAGEHLPRAVERWDAA